MNTTQFPERALKECVSAMTNKCVEPRHVKDVLKYPGVDVSVIEQFLSDPDEFVRKAAIEIVVTAGDKTKLVDFILREKNRRVLALGIRLLSRFGSTIKERLNPLVVLLNTLEVSLRNDLVEALNNSGRSDLLVSLLFEQDEALIYRIKMYMEQAKDK